MKEIVWVVGHSGAGKQTFCYSFTKSPDQTLVKQLGWSGLRIGVCESSIALVPRGHQSAKLDDRDELLDEIHRKQDSLDVILLKWQALDTQKGRVMAVAKLFPGIVMRALVLTVPGAVVQDRHEARESSWQPEKGWPDFLNYEKSIINKALEDFQQVDYVDAEHSYKLVKPSAEVIY
jgi:hypothetical protein